MKTFEIWMEGFAATGESGTAQKIGEAEGETFEEAVMAFTQPEDVVSKYDHKVIVSKGDTLNLDKDHDGKLKLSIWACRLFDNEQDARKSFG